MHALAAGVVVVLAGCGPTSSPTQPKATSPALSRFDTLRVELDHDTWFMANDFRWTVSTRDTSVIVSPDSNVAVIIYDTRDSLTIRVDGWKDPTTSPYMVCAPWVYTAHYPPQQDSWRVPGATPDLCVRVPSTLRFYQHWWQDPRYTGDPGPMPGHGNELVVLYATRLSQEQFWPMPCEH
jgi:hypothetical protein